jgi:CarD family transcriptional regulator
MFFQVGEKVVYPNHGVATVENISIRSFGTQSEKFYLLRLSASSLTVLLPFSHVQDVGLRRVTRNGRINRVLCFLSNGQCKCCADWKNRFKVNSEKMRGGDLLHVAEVLKGLLVLQHSKPLSFREKKMLDRARHMLITELSISRGIDEEEAVGLLQKALAKASLTLPLAL